MRRSFPALILASLLVAAPAAARISVGTFVAKANALRDNPLTALTSPDFPALKSEAQAAAAQLRADRDQRRAQGKPPIACLPAGETPGIYDMLDGLNALSPAEKRLPLKDGYARVLAKRYPCH